MVSEFIKGRLSIKIQPNINNKAKRDAFSNVKTNKELESLFFSSPEVLLISFGIDVCSPYPKNRLRPSDQTKIREKIATSSLLKKTAKIFPISKSENRFITVLTQDQNAPSKIFVVLSWVSFAIK